MDKEKRQSVAHLPDLREWPTKRRWMVIGAASASLLAMMTAFAVAPSALDANFSSERVVEEIAIAAAPVEADERFVREERIQRGDTLGIVFSRLGLEETALERLRAMPEARPLFQQVRPGKTVTAHMSREGDLVSLTFPLSGKDRVLLVERIGEEYTITEEPLELENRLIMRSAEIQTSLFAATDGAGIPDPIATQLAEIFAGDIDFHRDLRRGDRLSVVYEMGYSDGQPVRSGRVIAAEFTNQGKTSRAFYYGEEGQGGYYGPDGKSLKKAFLRSPLEFSRISSGFSMRFHPVLQEWRAHKGIDYAAPTGTRVRATGDGVVEFVGRQNGYGNVIVLRHQGRYTTHYGHLSAFSPAVRKGTRVNQGDTIGYVGMTGLASGPHLHYEFRVNDVHQNPLSAALPVAMPLEPNQMAEFRKYSAPLVGQLALLNSIPPGRFE